MTLLYIPAVQNFVKGKAVKYVETSLHMKLAVERILLKFPLELTIEKIYIGASEQDTLLIADAIQVNVSLFKLFRKELEVSELILENAILNFGDTLSGMKMKIAVEELNIRVDRLNLATQEVEIPFMTLKHGKVSLVLGESNADTTAGANSLHWRFKVGEIWLDSVDYKMSGLPMGDMHAGVGAARVKKVEVSLKEQTVVLEYISLLRGYCEIFLTNSGKDKNSRVDIKDTVVTQPWTVRASRVEMEDNRFLMKPEGVSLEAEKFPETIRISSLSLEMDSVFNRMTEFSAIIQRLKLKEGNGLNLQNLSCRVAVENNQVDVSHLNLKTPYTQLTINVKAESGISNFGMETPLQLSVDGHAAGRDMILFMPIGDVWMQEWLQDKTFSVTGLFHGQVDHLTIDSLTVASDKDFTLKSSGEISYTTNMERASGNLNVAVQVNNGAFLTALLSSKINQQFMIPDHLSFTATVQMAEQVVKTRLEVKSPQGKLAIEGRYGFKHDAYQANIRFDEFALDAFMPKDSLGPLTGTLVASGVGFNLERSVGKVDFDLKSFFYKGYIYKNIILNATLSDGKLDGRVESDNKELDLDLAFHLLSDKQGYKTNLSGDIRNVDLKALHFIPEELSFSLGIGIEAVLNIDSTSSLQAKFSNIMLKNRKTRQLGDVNLAFFGLHDKTKLAVDAGDFKLRFSGTGDGCKLVDQFTVVGKLLTQQLKDREFNMERVREILPDFQLNIMAGAGNVLNNYLNSKGISFNKIAMNTGTTTSTDFGMNAVVYGLNVDGIIIDSLLVKAYQKGEALDYGVSLYGAKNQLEGLTQLVVEGSAEHDQVNVRVREHGQEKGEIFNIGANIAFQDSSFSVSISPDPLVLGYVSWQINRGNYIRIAKNEIPSANLKLLNGDKRIRLTSEDGLDHKPASLNVDIKGIDLGHISKVISLIPDMSGLLGMDLQMHNKDNIMDIAGNISVNEFYYQKERIGNLGLGVNYRLSQKTEHDVDFSLSVDGQPALFTRGKLMAGTGDKNIDLDINIPQLPLRLANGFIPPGIVRLSGELIGNFQVKGQIDKPLIDGNCHFAEGKIEALPVGTTFKIDSSRITILNNSLRFNHFGLIAPNKQRMELQGSVNFASFSGIAMDASITAKNFQVMNVKENKETLVYGKVYVDLSATVKGMLDAMRIRGNVNLLDNSVITYTLKSSPLSVTDRSVDVVRFVSFCDSAKVEADDDLRQIRTVSMDLLMSVNIAPLVSLNLLLSDNGQNRVSINGGGDLTYTLNAVGETRLVGRYVLTSGVVSYGLPVIGQKDFSIQDGNYVEWAGDIANPTLNIVAAESVSTSVSDDSQTSRLVTFKAMIRITSTLKKPEITFDLSAVGDITIQNQLAAMTPEERSKEAMNLMIYGSYSGSGTVAKTNASNNAINSFVEKELNQWSRKYLKNMDLTFGINTYNQLSEGGETKKTDYSYQFSKRLFNNRVRVKVGGRISTDNDQAEGGVEENLVDDIAVEYVFGKNPNFFLKVFRHTGYESVLEGEVTQTGIGVVLRKKFQKVMDIFRKRKKGANS